MWSLRHVRFSDAGRGLRKIVSRGLRMIRPIKEFGAPSSLTSGLPAPRSPQVWAQCGSSMFGD